MFPVWLQAGFWGLVGGSALLLGVAVGYFVSIPQRTIATIMAFGAGVLISALSFELMGSLQARRFRLYGDRLFGGRCCLHSGQLVFGSTGSKTPQAIGHASPQLKQSQAMAD